MHVLLKSYFTYLYYTESLVILSVIKTEAHVLKPFALRKAKITYNFGLSECNRVKDFSSHKNS